MHVIWEYINKYLGWRNWAVFYYNSILENLFVILYITLVNSAWTNEQLVYITLYICFSILATSYGYLINDLADRTLDTLHNKPNTFSKDTAHKAIIVVSFFFIFTILFSIPFITKSYFSIFFMIWLFLATFYSLKPLRFKERGLLGLVIIIITQRVLPVVLLLLAFEHYLLVDWLLIIGLLFMRGAASDIWHQISDHENDIKTGTGTHAVKSGVSRMEQTFQLVLISERLFMLLFLILLIFRLHHIEVNGMPLCYILLTIYIILLAIIATKNYSIDARNPFLSKKNVYQVIHLVFPNIVIPVLLLVPLTKHNGNFASFFFLYVIMYRLYNMDILRHSVIVRFVRDFFRK